MLTTQFVLTKWISGCGSFLLKVLILAVDPTLRSGIIHGKKGKFPVSQRKGFPDDVFLFFSPVATECGC